MNNTSCVANIEVSASIVAESKINRDDVTKVRRPELINDKNLWTNFVGGKLLSLFGMCQ